jgi:hypothetical protein
MMCLEGRLQGQESASRRVEIHDISFPLTQQGPWPCTFAFDLQAGNGLSLKEGQLC